MAEMKVSPRVEGARAVSVERFTKADLDALSVHEDIKLRVTDDFRSGVPDGGCLPRSEAPHWSAAHPEDGSAIAVWQMLAPPPGVPVELPRWLRNQGLSYFRGWIRHAGADGPDYMMDWVIDVGDDGYVVHRNGDAGPFSPRPPADLQTFVDAVAHFSRDWLMTRIGQVIPPIMGEEPISTWLSDAMERVSTETLSSGSGPKRTAGRMASGRPSRRPSQRRTRRPPRPSGPASGMSSARPARSWSS